MTIDILLFPDFELLDAAGPIEVFSRTPEEPFSLRFVSMDGGPMKSAQGLTVETEPLGNISSEDVLFLPGGPGTRPLAKDESFISFLRKAAENAKYCLTVCTGSAVLSKTGHLDGRKATSNKRSFEWVKSCKEKVLWQGKARWVRDGKYYTSSGISAGTDMALGFVSDLYGREAAEAAAKRMEYIWNDDSVNDPFAK